jgi:TRAP transporter TAXI family solute receptor
MGENVMTKWNTIVAAGIACVLATGAAVAEGPQNLRIATTSPGSPWNILGVQVGDAMREKYDGLRTSSVSIGGSVANLVAVSRGEAQMAWAVDAAVEEAWQGINQFPSEVRNIRLIGPFAAVSLQVQARADSDLQSVEDLGTASIAVGGPGWPSTNMNETVLKTLGFSFDSINASGGQVHMVGHADWPPMLQDRVADAIMHWGGIPSGVTMSMVENPGIRVLGFTEDQVAKILETDVFSRSYATPVKLDGGLYEGIPEEGINTVAWMSMAVVNEDMDEDMVYDITKAMFDGLISGVYKDGISGSLESVKAVAEQTSVPFHPGAARYFAEHGVTVSTE